MITPRRIPPAALLGLLGLALALPACATTSPSSPRERFLAALDSLGYDTARTAAPRVAVTSETEGHQGRRIIPRIHVGDDAYVAVVNVWPSGVASVIYPDSPEEDGFLPGGKTYVMSPVFSGFATMFPPAGVQGLRYVRFGRSSDTHPGARGPGYLVLVASRTPLDLTALDTAGLFDEVDLGSNVREMEPVAVAPWIALLASGGNPAVTIDHARYGGYDGMTLHGSRFASSVDSRYCGSGYFGAPASYAWDFDYNPACNADAGRYGHLLGLGWTPPVRPRRPPVIRRDSARPPADTLHTPSVRSAEVRAAWSALVRQSEARGTGFATPADEEVDLPRSRDPRAMDDDMLERSGRSGDGRAAAVHRGKRSAERAPREPVSRDDRAPARPRAEAAPPRNEPSPRRADPAPPRSDPAPRPQPAEVPRRGDPQPRPAPSSDTP